VKERAEIAPEKIREVLNALPQPSRSLAQLLVLTGMRIGELLALRWRSVDLKQKRHSGDSDGLRGTFSMNPRVNAAGGRSH
jgi:integrase